MAHLRPNFFIVGTTKGGTSSLDIWLRSHPDVGAPRRKEMHFFCSCPNPRLRAATSLGEYLAAFPPGRAIGEASPCYLYYPQTPALLDQFTDSKVIISLRDPVERYWSHYLMNSVYRPDHRGPMEAFEFNLDRGRTNAIEDLLGVGLYAEQLRRYSEVFGPERILTLFLEEVTLDPAAAMADVLHFLHLPWHPIDTTTRDKVYVEPRGPVGDFLLRNRRTRRLGNLVLPLSVRRFLKSKVLGDPDRKPQMPDELRVALTHFYRDDARALESLLDRRLPWSWHHAEPAP
jgi:hypothetical protein